VNMAPPSDTVKRGLTRIYEGGDGAEPIKVRAVGMSRLPSPNQVPWKVEAAYMV